MMKLNIKNIPTGLEFLIPFVTKWGIGDDYEREAFVKNATDLELTELIELGNKISSNEILNYWLYEDTVQMNNPSNEYAAFTNFTMAIDSAKFEIKNRSH